jgi:hypothetical protein
MTTWSLYDASTGVFLGQTCSMPDGEALADLPDGVSAIPGDHDHTRTKVDIASGDVVEYTPPAAPIDLVALAAMARVERDRRLTACDWTDTASAPSRLGAALYGAWQEYRQQLRDITTAEGFPAEIIWPEPPDSSQ